MIVDLITSDPRATPGHTADLGTLAQLTSGETFIKIGTRSTDWSKWVAPLNMDVSPLFFGAVENSSSSAAINAKAFQAAVNFVRFSGGGKVYVPIGTFYLSYPVFLFDNVEIYGEGKHSKVVFIDPARSRGSAGFVIGSSRQANRDRAIANYWDGSYLSNASTLNTNFPSAALWENLRDYPDRVQCKDAGVRNLCIAANYVDPVRDLGFGVYMANAVNCQAKDIWAEGWARAVALGDLYGLEISATYLCRASRIQVLTTDSMVVEYAIGNIHNSLESSITDSEQIGPCPATTDPEITLNESLSMAWSEASVIENIRIYDLSEVAAQGSNMGVQVIDCTGCKISSIYARNNHFGSSIVVELYPSSNAPPTPILRPNVIENITGLGCTYLISLCSTYTRVSGLRNLGCTYDVGFFGEASGNTLDGILSELHFSNQHTEQWYRDNNSINAYGQGGGGLTPLDPSPAGTYSGVSSLTIDQYGRTTNAVAALSRRVPTDANTIGCYLFNETDYNATALVNSGSENTGQASTAFIRTLNDANSYPGRLGGLFGRYLRVPNTTCRLPTAVYSVSEAPYEVAISTARRFTISYWVRLWGTSYTGGVVGRPFYKQAKQAQGWSDPYYVLTPMEFWAGGYGDLSYMARGMVIFTGGLVAQTLYPYGLLSLSTADWYHFAFRYNGTSVASFVNGVLVASTTTMTNGTAINGQDINWDAHGPWVINRGTGESFPGTWDIQDLRIENTARSDAYILDMYERGVNRKR